MLRLLAAALGLGIACSTFVLAQDYNPPAQSDGNKLYVLPSDDEPARPRGRSSAYVVPQEVNREPAADVAPLPPPPRAPKLEEPPPFVPHMPAQPIATAPPAPEPQRNVELANYTTPVSPPVATTPQPMLVTPATSIPIAAPLAASTSLPLAPKTENAKGLERPAAAGTTNTITGVAVSLALVLGLFVLFAWFARSSMPQGMTRLPSEVIEPLGRMPMTGKQELHLLRLGNKLVLMAVSPGGMEAISEVTDPSEVDRILGLCRRGSNGSSIAAFREVVAQVSAEPTRGGFAGQFARAVPGTTRKS